MTWNILLIQPQCEFKAMAGLADYGFTAYLPTIKRTIIRGRSRQRIVLDRPLFPGYLFLMTPTGRQSLIHSVSGVRGYLRCGEGLAALSEAAIAIVRHCEAEALSANTATPASPFRVGENVQINNPSHSAHMMKGMLKRLDKSDRATIEVIMPSLAVTVTTDVTWLEAVNS